MYYDTRHEIKTLPSALYDLVGNALIVKAEMPLWLHEGCVYDGVFYGN
jgi:hypothetical protein